MSGYPLQKYTWDAYSEWVPSENGEMVYAAAAEEHEKESVARAGQDGLAQGFKDGSLYTARECVEAVELVIEKAESYGDEIDPQDILNALNKIVERYRHEEES